MDGQREDRGVNSQPSQHFNTACLLNYRHLSFFWGVTPNPFTNILLQRSCLSSKVSIACLVLVYLLDPLIHSQAVNQEGWLSVFFFIKSAKCIDFLCQTEFQTLDKTYQQPLFFFLHRSNIFNAVCCQCTHCIVFKSGEWFMRKYHTSDNEKVHRSGSMEQAHAEHYKTGNTIIRSLKRTPNKMAFPWYIAVLLEEN